MNGARRLVASGAALTALLVAVAIASHAHRPGGGTGGGASDTGKLVFDYVLSGFAVLFPIAVIIVVWIFVVARRQKLLAGGGSIRRQALGLLVVAALAFPAALAVRHFVHYVMPPRPPQQLVPAQKPGTPPRGKNGAHRRQPGEPEFRWVAALTVGSLLVAFVGGVGVMLLWKRRSGPAWQHEAELIAALDEVLADTLDDLRAERDPRRAVIAAYARMERTFAAHDVVRDAAETPREYVERALDRFGVDTFAVRRLTALYERAKFSRHEIDISMKDDAIDALAGLRAELAAGEEAAAA